jgi:hypothetical protein
MDVWVVLLVGIERARFEFKGEASRRQEGGCVVLCCIVLCYGYAEKRRCPGGSESDDVTAVTMFKMTR